MHLIKDECRKIKFYYSLSSSFFITEWDLNNKGMESHVIESIVKEMK